MRADRFPFITVFTAIFLASLVNILPLRMFHAGGDMDFHLVLIDCFASQFWQGDLYPRWCMEANAGLGSPVFLFYFPLPYYAAGLLWPLTHAGLSLEGLYTLSSFTATALTGLTCYAWLKDITTAPRALLVSVLLLFMPYRMEAMLFRAAYAEIWCFVFMPLFFKYLRRLVQGQKGSLPALAAVVALMLTTHIPVSITAFIAGGIYVLVASDRRWQAIVRLKLAWAWGIAIASFYLFPGFYFRRFMLPPGQLDEPSPWANNHMSWQNLSEQGRAVAGDAMAMLALLLLAGWILWRGKKQITDSFARREVKAWCLASVVAAFLLFPVSKFLYEAFRPWSAIVFPWRMQAVFMVATAFLLAVWMQWFVTPKRLRTWRGDYGMLFVLLVLLSYFMVGIRGDDRVLEENIRKSQLIAEPEYRSQWTDKPHFSDAYIFNRLTKKPAPVEIISGKGKAQVQEWGWEGIGLSVEAVEKPVTIRLDHLYFPLWHLGLPDYEGVTLQPQDNTGLMLITVPPGKHSIKLAYTLAYGQTGFIWFFNIISWAGGLCCGWRLLRGRLARWALTRRQLHATY